MKKVILSLFLYFFSLNMFGAERLIKQEIKKEGLGGYVQFDVPYEALDINIKNSTGSQLKLTIKRRSDLNFFGPTKTICKHHHELGEDHIIDCASFSEIQGKIIIHLVERVLGESRSKNIIRFDTDKQFRRTLHRTLKGCIKSFIFPG